jgi:hypothetical protein
MRNLTLLIILSTIFTSCQKVLDITSQFQDPKSVILDKVTFPLDSTGNSVGTTYYTYDSEKRLIVQKTVLLKDGQVVPDSYTKYERDELGRITRSIYTSAAFAAQPGLDSIYTYFYYQSPTSNLIAYTRHDIPNPEHLNADSSVYTYNTEGRVANIAQYYSPDGLPFDNTYNSINYEYDGREM